MKKGRIYSILVVVFLICFAVSTSFAESIKYENIVEPLHVIARVVSEKPLKIEILSYPYRGQVVNLKSGNTFEKDKLLACEISSKGIKCKPFEVQR